MRTIKTITIAIPVSFGNELSKMAKQEHKTVPALLREVLRQYRVSRNRGRISKEARKPVRQKGNTLPFNKLRGCLKHYTSTEKEMKDLKKIWEPKL